MIYTLPKPFEIFQFPGRVFMLFEQGHWIRQIWVDGRSQIKEPEPTWMGQSVGKWDGDTLVIDTVVIKAGWLDNAGHVHSDQFHIEERLRRVDHDTLVNNITFEDPNVFSSKNPSDPSAREIKPWKGQKVFKLVPGGVIGESLACNDTPYWAPGF